MKGRTSALFVAGSLFACSALAGQPPVRAVVGEGIRVDPVRIASMEKLDGRYVMTSDWIPYGGFTERQVDSGCLFDCFGRNWGPGSNGAPLGSCGRYFFGTSAHMPNSNDDMSKHRNGRVTEFDWAFTWNVFVPSPMFAAVLVGNGDPNACEALSSGTGFVLDYGVLSPIVGFAYSNVDLLSLPTPVSLTGTTSYQLILAGAYDAETQEFTLAKGPCQPLLYGSPENLRANAPDSIGIGAYGDQGPKAFDDGDPLDGVFDPTKECFSYDFGPGFCVNWFGKAVAFGGCATDFDGDGFSTGDDYDAFVVQFELGNAAGDYDGDGFVTGDDFDKFVEAFEWGC